MWVLCDKIPSLSYALLEYRSLSDFEKRKQRLLAISLSVVTEALERARKRLPLSTEQYIAANLGFLPPHPGKMQKREL